MRDNDTELIRRTLTGDETAFTMLVNKYRKHVHTLAWHKVGDFHIAEDITQETFLQVYRDLATLKEPDRFPGWLYVVTNHRCIAWFRKHRSQVRLVEGINMAMKRGAAYSRYVADEQAKTATEAQQTVVKQLLAKLKESERTVMTLYYFGEMTCEEISKFLGVSVNTIKSRLSRARQRLKKEEPIIREALDSFQLSANLTENIVRKIAHIKPVAPSRGKPLVPWAIAVSTVTVILLMIGIGNQYLLHFQHPYSFEAESEHTIEIVDAPIVLNMDSKPDVRNQTGRVLFSGKNDRTGSQTSETLSTAATAEDSVMDERNIELCTQNLLAIGKAIETYERAHADLPGWLSDLYPKYLVDSNVLTCPADKYNGKAGRPWNRDPKMSVSYDYQFYPEYRGKKSEQRMVYGDTMPLVRCRHHANEDLHVLNLSFSYMVYRSSVNWEFTPEDMYGSDEITITAFEETLERHPDDMRFFSLYPGLVRLYAKTGDEPSADVFIERLKSAMKLEIPSYSALWNLWNILVMMERYEDLLEIFTVAEQQTPDEKFILERLSFIHERLGNAELAEVYGRKFDPRYELLGMPVPDFSATDLEGYPISLQDYRGKVVLLDFWVLWSPTCVLEMPDIRKIYDTYKDDGFDIIGVNLDDEEVILQNYVEENSIPWRQIFDQGAGEASLALQYGIGDIPEMWLIDRKGGLITHKARGADLERLVAEAVEAQSPQ